MRGKGCIIEKTCIMFRITPACAGKRYRHRSVVLRSEDHPRVCGEKPTLRVDGGKSPGITPACAGKRYEGDADKLFPHGSPPRVRGKALFSAISNGLKGITPACAGKSCSASWTVNLRQRITPACAGKSTEVFQN